MDKITAARVIEAIDALTRTDLKPPTPEQYKEAAEHNRKVAEQLKGETWVISED